MICRRNFIKSLGIGAIAYPACELMAAQAVSGRRGGGVVPFAGIDGRSMSHGPESKTEVMVNEAIAQGFTFFDTANYDLDGRTERRFGKLLVPQYRNRIFLQSKTNGRSKAVAAADVDLSLVRLQTDYLDSYLMESVIKIRNEAFFEFPSPDTFEGLIAAREEGKVRRIGVRMVSNESAVMLDILKQYGDSVDTVAVPFGLSNEDEVIQQCRRRGISMMLNVDSEAQRALLKGRYEEINLPEYAASWIVGTANLQDIKRYASRIAELI